MSEEQNSRLYNENNDYGERDYAPRKSGKKKKRKESGGHVGRCILQVLGTLLLVGLCTGAILCCFAAVYIKTVIIPEAGAVDLSQFAVGENSVMYYMDQDTGNYREPPPARQGHSRAAFRSPFCPASCTRSAHGRGARNTP